MPESDAAPGALESSGGTGEPGEEAIRRALEGRGVPASFAAAFARGVAADPRAADPQHLEAMLDGIALALAVQRTTEEQLTRSLQGLREVERMMGAFSGELSKLDEVLGVLAAYVRRMKTSGKALPQRTLH